jgi:hypothetical protein
VKRFPSLSPGNPDDLFIESKFKNQYLPMDAGAMELEK